MSKQGKTRGRQRAYPLQDLYKLFEKYQSKIVGEDEKVIPPSDPFWAYLIKDNKIPSQPRNIYTDAWKWHKNREEKKSSESESDFDDALEDEISTENSSSAESLSDDSKVNENDIKFKVKLTSQLWKLMEPIPKSYHRRADKNHKRGVRSYLVLKPGSWSNIIVEKIAQHPKNIICNFTFKRLCYSRRQELCHDQCFMCKLSI